MEHDERGIERLEIEGDWWEEITDADIDAHYLDWCERHGIVPELVPIGKGTDPEGEEVSVYTFA